MNLSSVPTAAERIESVKAGILAALSATLAYGAIAVVNSLILAESFEFLQELQITTGINLLIKLAIACLSGFLFGVTYRYAVRTDPNPHLKTGVVMAFGLVRGLALVEVKHNGMDSFWLLAVLLVESILYFAIARLALDSAFHRSWVKPFKSS
ncbi:MULTISPECIES: hypothetical protein [unclassified Coleofasciculus]|uniref:hypothetical protein n=1 Tax=unclassified Coleofasciculus TaxID=2692782 RepID=UPI001881EF4A|nr:MULTISPECIES: hypothetical protein [unclassified Coleofasciculus]MBE9127264.1 hypothetical protein [Coleofasciculus sp. LEGE 07081]MBE9150584.1 hypothetical protein [Coleofasciculus sp. LEGE 07092]